MRNCCAALPALNMISNILNRKMSCTCQLGCLAQLPSEIMTALDMIPV